MFSRRFDADARRRFGKKFARKYRRNDTYLHIAKTVRRFVIVFNKYAPNTFRESDFFTSTFFITRTLQYDSVAYVFSSVYYAATARNHSRMPFMCILVITGCVFRT